tara:strand:+ start:697 stop:1107 length:411 start_codon:yes stop_codon:yes gene_type:complete
MDNYRLKGKQALSLIIKDDIDVIENNIFNNSVTTEEYKLIIQDILRIYRENSNYDLIEDVKNELYLYNHNRFDNIKKTIKEYDSFILKPFEVDEGVLTCNKCNSNKTYSYTKQTRSGDEATTVFAICSNCNARWTV